MYADVVKIQEDMVEVENHTMMANIERKGQQANRKKIEKLVTEYNAYKKSKLQNFRFNPTKAATQFGEFS